MSSDLFQREAIIEHYRNPRRKGLLRAPDGRAHDSNPFCGDEVTIDLRVEEDRIVDAAFDGRGCSLSQATASILVDTVVGKSVAEVGRWDETFVLDLLGIEIGPVRVKCAMLPLTVVQRAAAQATTAESSKADIDKTEMG